MRTFAILFFLCISPAAPADTVKIDNQAVRITEIAYAPHVNQPATVDEINRLVISLDTGDMELISANGRKRNQHWEIGQAVWLPSGESNSIENLGAKPVRAIEIELKNPPPFDPVKRDPKLDPIAIDPKHDILILENDQVRVFRSWLEPHATEKLHQHVGAGRAAILLTDINAIVKSPVDAVTPVQAKAGDVLWSGPITHSTTNVSSRKFEMIVVEVK